MIIKGDKGNKNLRVLEAFTALIIWFKALYYLQLFDNISPLVVIIFEIFQGIITFIVILIIFMFAFASAFYMIGRN